jgi:hypothetical protein
MRVRAHPRGLDSVHRCRHVAQLALALASQHTARMKYIGDEELSAVTGGMQWQKFRRSTNVEDRRTPAGKRRDEAWWRQTHPEPPLPPRRPVGL